ncbi:hypothetical protein N431DRAFT_532970 [Stipitochalara longipes BDJ]|nr:hypothetical protein N431DRAFT_532970 [Stipitochalara longipes BDJ]
MVFLGPKDGQIEVRLVKPPFDAADTDRVYIDEYEKLGTPHQEKGSFEYYRYTASKDTTYGIEITLKKGFSWGQFLGIKVVVHDKARNVRIGFRECPKTGWGENLLDTDKRLMVNSLDGVIIGGKRKDDVNLSFRVLATDEDLKLETNVPGIEPSDLGGFKIEVYRYGERNYEELPNSRHEENLREYQARLATRASMVDEKSFTKHGITHNIELEGGVERQLKPPSKYQFLHSYSKEVYFHYFCRSLDFLEENSFHKCPIPMEFQPWDSLKDHERQSCFKALQTYDKEALLKYTIAEAAPGADVKAIQRQLLELGHIPNHWRGWGQLYTRERQKHFEYLQRRRKDWERNSTRREEARTRCEAPNSTSCIPNKYQRGICRHAGAITTYPGSSNNHQGGAR